MIIGLCLVLTLLSVRADETRKACLDVVGKPIIEGADNTTGARECKVILEGWANKAETKEFRDLSVYCKRKQCACKNQAYNESSDPDHPSCIGVITFPVPNFVNCSLLSSTDCDWRLEAQYLDYFKCTGKLADRRNRTTLSLLQDTCVQSLCTSDDLQPVKGTLTSDILLKLCSNYQREAEYLGGLKQFIQLTTTNTAIMTQASQDALTKEIATTLNLNATAFVFLVETLGKVDIVIRDVVKPLDGLKPMTTDNQVAVGLLAAIPSLKTTYSVTTIDIINPDKSIAKTIKLDAQPAASPAAGSQAPGTPAPASPGGSSPTPTTTSPATSTSPPGPVATPKSPPATPPMAPPNPDDTQDPNVDPNNTANFVYAGIAIAVLILVGTVGVVLHSRRNLPLVEGDGTSNAPQEMQTPLVSASNVPGVAGSPTTKAPMVEI